jgi:hypothetical protein
MNLGSNDFIHHIELLVKETGNVSYSSLSPFQNQGSITNLNQMNLYSVMEAFFKSSTPTYQPIEMQVIDNNDLSSNESHYAALVDITPSYFNQNNNEPSNEISNMNLENDIFIQWYFLALSLITLYIIYKFMLKE